VLVAGDVLHADALHVVERRAQAHGVGDVAGAGLERLGGGWNTVFSKVTSAIMLPPPCQGGMASSSSRLP
jgi:hypothetical protein